MKVFRNYWPIIILIVISSFLAILNYTPGTFLSGWDTLHPEFNFGLAFERTLFGVFRVEQGLGAVAAHSHMADLPRIILLYIFHFFLPIDLLRYSYVFLNILLGPLGMYFLLEKHFLKNKNASFLAALFYLLNLGTLQIFNVPFEMFTTLFATLPFIFYFAMSFLTDKTERAKNLFLFSVFVLLSSPSAYASTLWYVFFLSFIFYLLSYILLNRDKGYRIKDGVILILLVLVLNSFWLLPNIYFLLNHAKEVQNANINLLFSEQAFLKNKEFGNPLSILLFKIFYFDWNIWSGTKFVYLLEPYINYLKNPNVLSVGFLFGMGVLTGIVVMIKRLKSSSVPLSLLLLISLFFLFNDNFPFSPLFSFLRENVPFFKEALRFPQDKILNIYVFLVSIFFGYFCLFVIEKLEKIKWAPILFVSIISLLIFYYNLPSFGGNFINKLLRVDIPKEYFQLFDYLNTQDKSVKVANLPVNSPWGWAYYDFGFQGAGFLYFGTPQSLLDRDFDRWSPYNESYYREMSYAIYKKDAVLLKNVLSKYNVGFVFVDEAVFDPQRSKSTMFYNESRQLIKESGLVQDEKKFGTISLYKIKDKKGYFANANTNINVNPSTKTLYDDFAYNAYGDYLTFEPQAGFNNIVFPFRNLIDNQSRLFSNILSLDSEKIVINPSARIESFQAFDFAENIDTVPSDVIVEKRSQSLTINIYPNTPVFDNTPTSNPIKTVLNIPSTAQALYLSVNQNELFKLDISEETPVAVGKIILKNSENDVAVFDAENTIQIAAVGQKINPFFSNCDEVSAPPSVVVTEGSFDIKAASDICILVPLGFLEEGSGALLVNFGFLKQGGNEVTSCLYNQGTSKCEYYKPPQINGDFVNFTYAVRKTETQNRALKIFIDKSKLGEETIKLGNFSSSFSNSLSEAVIPQNTLSNAFIKGQKLSFDKIYLPNNIIYSPGFEITSLKKLESDCRGPLPVDARKELTTESGRRAIKYSSGVGSFCDHFSYPNLVHNLGYFLVIDSKNAKGLPFSICVLNYTSKRCDIYTYLSGSDKFTKQVFLLPPMDDGGIGYDIALENLGIKGSPSENFISSLQFIPIPYELLGNMKQSNMQSANTFSGRIISEKKINPFMYVVQTDGKPQVLSLSYSFENGFKAYPVECRSELSCLTKAFFAPLVVKPLPQVLVNNWKNGWLVDSNNGAMEQLNNKIVVVFVPQYLEFFGFALAGIIFVFLLFQKTQNTRKSRNSENQNISDLQIE